MSKTFLPEWGQMPDGVMYRPIFKLFAGDDWKMVLVNKQPVKCATAGQAIAAAKEHVESILNPKIRSEQIEMIDADVLGIEEWRQRREQEASEERERVFGGNVPATIFPGRGRPPVAVEYRRRRA